MSRPMIATKPSSGWIVLRKSTRGDWDMLLWTLARTRRDAIAKFDYVFDTSGEYALRRRRGLVRAVRCTITADRPADQKEPRDGQPQG